MAESEPGEETAGGQATGGKTFGIRRIYTRDVSFESPNTPQIFHEEKWSPETTINLTNNISKLGDDRHEVTLLATVTAKIGDKTAYLVEVQQAGDFRTTGFEGRELHELLGIYCPGLLFPFLRETVSSLVSKGGFPPLILAPVNFEALYAQHMTQLKTQQNEATTTD